jgi:hypothetical protein
VAPLMELLLRRRPAIGGALTGDFSIDGKLFAFSLERSSRAIRPGRYRVDFTVSDRASRGELWTPDHEHRLPLIVVPGRSGIRIHAANEYEELLGCVALGKRLSGAELLYSRAAVAPFIDRLEAAIAAGQETWIEIQNAEVL